VAARASGETVFRGVAELRVKESDRIRAIADNLRALGVDVEERPDELLVRGGDGRLEGQVPAHGDHRIAMAFGALSVATGGRIDVTGRDVVAISYPGFWGELARVKTELER
jgi:3-phosphoshikimate 1-carboxyvinyltransferase